MGHPYAGHRQSKVEKDRVSHIAHRAAGGRIEAPNDVKKVLRKEKAVSANTKEVDGDTAPKSKHRADRPGRKRGGRVKGSKTVVNVITGGQQPPAVPMAPPPGMSPMGPQGLAAKPPMAPPGGPMGGPPPAGIGPGPIPRKRGGRVNDGTKVFNKSMKEAGERPIKHDKGKNDLKDMNRGRVVTFKTGGGVVKFRAHGGRIESSKGVAPATKLPGGAGGGEGRLKKAADAKRK